MAFQASGANTFSNGVGPGFLFYSSVGQTGDTLSVIGGANYFATAIPDGDKAFETKRARAGMEKFIRDNRVGTGAMDGVPILIVGTDGQFWDHAYLNTAGRIRLRGGKWRTAQV